jgi:hypothetical protein
MNRPGCALLRLSGVVAGVATMLQGPAALAVWEQQSFVPNQNNALLDVAASGADRAAALGVQDQGGQSAPVVLYTSNGGRSWSPGRLPASQNPLDFVFPTTITFIGPAKVLAGGAGFAMKVYRSTDGGATWTDIPNLNLGMGGFSQLVSPGPDRAVGTTGDKVLALKRHSWFSIEFGLIEEAGETKVFRASILSSIGEIPNSLFSKDVERRPFVTDEVIATDYDPSRMQDLLFVLPSLSFLRREVERLVTRFGVTV